MPDSYWAVQHFDTILFTMLYVVILTFESVHEILRCDHSNESYWAVLSCGAVYYATRGDGTLRCGYLSFSCLFSVLEFIFLYFAHTKKKSGFCSVWDLDSVWILENKHLNAIWALLSLVSPSPPSEANLGEKNCSPAEKSRQSYLRQNERQYVAKVGRIPDDDWNWSGTKVFLEIIPQALETYLNFQEELCAKVKRQLI